MSNTTTKTSSNLNDPMSTSFSDTLSANAHFLGGSIPSTKVNKLIQTCFGCMSEVDTLRGRIPSDQYNYIQEHFNQIIMLLTGISSNVNNVGAYNLFSKPYRRDNLMNIPVYPRLAPPTMSDALTVPKEYKVLSSLDKQLAYDKFGERIVVPTINTDPTVGQPDQVIVGNGFDIGRHLTPMSMNKYR